MKAIKNLKVSEVMSTELVKVETNSILHVVEKLFQEHGIHHIPVTDDKGELKGIISHSDIQLLKDWGSRYNLKRSHESNEFLLKSQLASEIMEKSVTTISPNNTLGECAYIFNENLFHCLPVVENSKLVGMITTYDLIKVAYQEVEVSIN